MSLQLQRKTSGGRPLNTFVYVIISAQKFKQLQDKKRNHVNWRTVFFSPPFRPKGLRCVNRCGQVCVYLFVCLQDHLQGWLPYGKRRALTAVATTVKASSPTPMGTIRTYRVGPIFGGERYRARALPPPPQPSSVRYLLRPDRVATAAESVTVNGSWWRDSKGGRVAEGEEQNKKKHGIPLARVARTRSSDEPVHCRPARCVVAVARAVAASPLCCCSNTRFPVHRLSSSERSPISGTYTSPYRCSTNSNVTSCSRPFSRV